MLVVGNHYLINLGPGLDAPRRLVYPLKVLERLEIASTEASLRRWLRCLERAATRASLSPEVWSSWALVWLGAALAARRGLLPSPPDPELAGPVEWLSIARAEPRLAGARLLDGDFAPLTDAIEKKAMGKCREAFARLLEDDSTVEVLGRVHERLLDWDTTGGQRRRTGSFYTPPAVCRLIADRALEGVTSAEEPPSICDPAAGGGAFLLACLRRLAPDPGHSARRLDVARRLVGVDRSARALAVAEWSLWLELGMRDLPIQRLPTRLLLGDSLDVDLNPGGKKHGWSWQQLAPSGFDLVIGNPPWIAFAGRAAQALPQEVRKRYARHFEAWRGYPTLHGLFVELACKLARKGRVALLLPSPVADLDGYRAVRQVATSRHRLLLPLPELGVDAFAGVTQPSFCLLLDAAPTAQADCLPWALVERQSRASAASQVSVPEVLTQLSALPRLPERCFGERGFQSAGEVSRSLFLRGDGPSGEFSVGLLEGKDVREFHVGPTRLFLRPDPVVLGRHRAKLRPAEAYQQVDFVVRQTASHPIAALHDGRFFRNTLLAGFGVEGLSAELLVGLLNSALYRALHVAQNRDARQKVFPQVKIRQLRALPAPPDLPTRRERIEALVLEASACSRGGGDLAVLTRGLDEAVFELFELEAVSREAILAFLSEVAPRSLASRSVPELAGQIAHEGEQRRQDGDHSDP